MEGEKAIAQQGPGTKAIHAGQHPDPITGAVVVPLSLATTYQQKSPGVHMGFEYSRTGNPTRKVLEENIATCENGKYGIAFASGSATTASVVHLLKAGDHVVAMDDAYGGTFRYFTKIAATMGISFSFIDFTIDGAIEDAIQENTKLIWMETPTNPMLKIVDIRKVSAVSKKHNTILVVDNTFLTPYFQTPLDLGADIVVHSMTKYLNGHSDVVMGIAVTNSEDLKTRLKFVQNGIGAVPSPFDCFMVLRGMKTLHLRMKAHAKNAAKVAKFLEGHPKVAKVIYPGLPSHPQHELAKTQMRGFGGMVSFTLKGDITQARQFLENLHLFALAESLGAVESLANHPAIMTHASVPPESRAKLGITDALVRLSVGVEDADDILSDLESALQHVVV
eukprot:TRINITY_DN7594_c0_g1_i1.p1 TRINITY_DN7594_c0_g1~~TRINITY_DN7594_c0_g1_i1.p1  ORF type:complete len:392 (-),score=68.80 TRINITY_DN7594_c0_g1_i1:22-1197(-)